jgi:heptosyltransferase II
MAESPRIIRPMKPRPLIVRLRNWVGDVTLGLPALLRLQEAGYTLTLVGKRWAADLLAGHGWPVLTMPDSLPDRVRQLRDWRVGARSSDGGLDDRLNALLLPYSFSSALEARLAGLRAAGFAYEGRGPLLSRRVARPSGRHEMDVYWQLASALLGLDAPTPDRVCLAVADRHVADALALRRQHDVREGYIVVCPFARGTYDKVDKAWPGFARFAAEALPSLGRDIVACPGPGDEEALCERDFPRCKALHGVGLGAYTALLRDAALVIANDTGPGHLAAAVGAPLVSVLGPTEAEVWGARGPTVRVVQRPRDPHGAVRWPDALSVLDACEAMLRGAPG